MLTNGDEKKKDEKSSLSSIQKFRIIVSTLGKLAGLKEFPTEESEKIAISLYDQWLNSKNLKSLDMVELGTCETSEGDNIDKILKYLIAVLSLLDPTERIAPLILEHTLESDDDFDIKLSEFLPKQRLTGPEASIYRILTIYTLALGNAFKDAGNSKLGFHLISLASTVQERVNRTSSRVVIDELIIRLLYSGMIQLAIRLNDHEQAIETATKLISRWDIVLAQVLEKEVLVNEFDFKNYFETLILLAQAGEKAQRYESCIYAYQKLLNLFSVQIQIAKEPSCLDFIASSHDEQEIFQQKICLDLVKANEKILGDSFISLEYTRSALEHFNLIGNCKKNHNDEVELKFLLARVIYKAAISLAGGVEHASSPPIAVLSPSINAPTIKGLLEEAMYVLEDILPLALSGKLNENCKEAIEMQIAIVAMELRLEEKAKMILTNQSFYNSTLLSWEASKHSESGKKSFDYLKNVVYSVDVFKRLLTSIAPSISRMSRTLTLSGKQAEKVQCAYCSMQARSALRCEDCAEAKLFVWYCSEDCMQDHLPQHLNTQCVRNYSNDTSREHSGMDLSSIFHQLPSIATQTLEGWKNMRKKGKDVAVSEKFVPMPTHWPGKISDENLFATFAKQTREQLEASYESPLVALRISQLGLKSFTDFVIILPKSSTILRLQLEIARHQFDGSVSPSDIVIFLSKVDNAFEKIEKRVQKRENTVLSGADTTGIDADINYAIGIAPKFICADSSRTLISYFPDMKNYKLPSDIKETTSPVFLRDLVDNEQSTSMKRTKRYTDFYAEDKLDAKKLSKLQFYNNRDYEHPTFSIFFDVKEYCKIKTYKNNFEQIIALDSSWMMKPTDLNAPRELLYTSTDPDYIHNSLLLYEPVQSILNNYNTTSKESEEAEKRKGNISFKTIAFLKAKSKVKKMDVDKRLGNRSFALTNMISKTPHVIGDEENHDLEMGLQVPNTRRLSNLVNSNQSKDLAAAKNFVQTRRDSINSSTLPQLPSLKKDTNVTSSKGKLSPKIQEEVHKSLS